MVAAPARIAGVYSEELAGPAASAWESTACQIGRPIGGQHADYDWHRALQSLCL